MTFCGLYVGILTPSLIVVTDVSKYQMFVMSHFYTEQPYVGELQTVLLTLSVLTSWCTDYCNSGPNLNILKILSMLDTLENWNFPKTFESKVIGFQHFRSLFSSYDHFVSLGHHM